MFHALVLAALATISAPVAGATAPAGPPPGVAEEFVAATPVETVEPLAGDLQRLDTPALGAHVRFLAAEALGGRGLGTVALDAAAEYVAAQLAVAGLAPFGDRNGDGAPSYFQEVAVRGLAAPTAELAVERSAAGASARRVFRSGVDLAVAGIPPGAWHGPLVDAGWGIREPALGRDDWRGLEARGRIVLVRAGLPPGESWQTEPLRDRWSARDEDERDDAKLAVARELGAALLLVVEPEGFASRLARGELAAEPFFLPRLDDGEEPGPPRVRVDRSVAALLLGTPERIAAPAPGPVADTMVELVVAATERTVLARNVLAVLPGADPASRDEAVVLGAHYDHLGMRGGKLHPGADDNASGTAALLEIARTFAASPRPPRRSLIFAFWTGEEEGHLGSRSYLQSPRWPLARTTAYLNLDMIGHPWTAEELARLVADRTLPDAPGFLASFAPADFVEPGLPAGRPELVAALRAAAAATGLALHFDFTDGRQGGSDYRGFARRGIPFVRFFGNFFPAYHEPGDTAERLDLAQVRRVARLAFVSARELADR